MITRQLITQFIKEIFRPRRKKIKLKKIQWAELLRMNYEDLRYYMNDVVADNPRFLRVIADMDVDAAIGDGLDGFSMANQGMLRGICAYLGKKDPSKNEQINRNNKNNSQKVCKIN